MLVVERRAPLDKDFVKQIKAFGDDISTYSYDAEPPVIRPEEEVTYNKFATQYYMDFAATRARLARSSAIQENIRARVPKTSRRRQVRSGFPRRRSDK